MKWAVTQSQTEEEWFEVYVASALSSPAPTLPPEHQKIGSADAIWFPCEEGVAHIATSGGSPDDRVLAEIVVRNQLAGHGIRQAQYTFDQDEDFRKTAGWNDIMAKAKRLIQSQQVHLLRNGPNNIVAQVQGDHDTYQSEISRDDPTSRAITQWTCECPWDQYAFQRTRKWKKYEGRPCAHVLAAYWKSLATPLDEDMAAQQQQGTLFDAPQAAPPANGPSPFAAPGGAPADPSQQMMLPGMMPGQATGSPPMPGQTMPPDPSVIPPFPMAEQPPGPMVNPASVPGLKQPSPTNPVQYPGGTFSSVDWTFGDGYDNLPHMAAGQPSGYQNGNMVSTTVVDWGTLIGRSEDHGSGQNIQIPKGSVGEVLGQDPTTGMVNVLFENKMTENMGSLEPNGVVAWFFESELKERPDVRRPGPAVKRR